MSDGVKIIFKTLIGTAIAIVVISLFAEMLNVSLYGVQLKQITKMALSQSMTLFAQESYKNRNSDNSTNSDYASLGNYGGTSAIRAIYTADGTEYVPGNFYSSNDPKTVYNDLYKNNTSFRNWINTTGVEGNWYIINLVNQYLNAESTFPVRTQPQINVSSLTADNYDAAMELYEARTAEYTEYSMAKSYVENLVTPLNYGIPYMDKDVLQRIFQWNLTMLLSSCSSDNIINYSEYDPSIDKYGVRTNGFIVFTNEAQVTNVSYKVYDLEDESDATEFKALTHINKDNLGFAGEIEYLGDSTGDERKRVCVVTAEYDVPVRYVGVSPLKQIFDFAWRNEVEGLRGRPGNTPQTFNYASSSLTGGGFNGNEDLAGVLPIPGKLVYYLVR